jgi:hypothetical protein
VGTAGTLDAWFQQHAPVVQEVPEILRRKADEVGVVVQDRIRLVCLSECRLFRLMERKLPHVTVYRWSIAMAKVHLPSWWSAV